MGRVTGGLFNQFGGTGDINMRVFEPLGSTRRAAVSIDIDL
jgi:hypothetical protein